MTHQKMATAMMTLAARAGLIKDEPLASEPIHPSSTTKGKAQSLLSLSRVKSRATSGSSVDKKEIVEWPSETSVKMEQLDPAKPSRSASQKAIRSAPLFDHLEDATMEAIRSSAVLELVPMLTNSWATLSMRWSVIVMKSGVNKSLLRRTSWRDIEQD